MGKVFTPGAAARGELNKTMEVMRVAAAQKGAQEAHHAHRVSTRRPGTGAVIFLWNGFVRAHRVAMTADKPNMCLPPGQCGLPMAGMEIRQVPLPG